MVEEAYQVKYFNSQSSAATDLLSLSIFVSEHQFQYAIFKNSFKNIIELADIEFKEAHLPNYQAIDLISIIVNNQFLNQKKFEKVNISVLNNQFTLLPEAFAQDLDHSALLSFANGENNASKSLHHKTKYCFFSYQLPNDWLDFFGKTFPQANIYHASAINVSLLFEQFSLINTELFLNIHQNQIEISAKQNRALLFYNVFSYESKEDILYYLLFTMEQLELNPLLCKLSLASQLETNDELINSLKKYVKHLDFCVMDKSISSETIDNKLPNHFYFTLLNQHLCE